MQTLVKSRQNTVILDLNAIDWIKLSPSSLSSWVDLSSGWMGWEASWNWLVAWRRLCDWCFSRCSSPSGPPHACPPWHLLGKAPPHWQFNLQGQRSIVPFGLLTVSRVTSIVFSHPGKDLKDLSIFLFTSWGPGTWIHPLIKYIYWTSTVCWALCQALGIQR